jgi:hypothetical protein
LQTIFSEDAMSIGDGTRQMFVPTGFYKVSFRHTAPFTSMPLRVGFTVQFSK